MFKNVLRKQPTFETLLIKDMSRTLVKFCKKLNLNLNLTQINEYRVLIVITPESGYIVPKLALRRSLSINATNTFVKCLLKGKKNVNIGTKWLIKSSSSTYFLELTQNHLNTKVTII